MKIFSSKKGFVLLGLISFVQSCNIIYAFFERTILAPGWPLETDAFFYLTEFRSIIEGEEQRQSLGKVFFLLLAPLLKLGWATDLVAYYWLIFLVEIALCVGGAVLSWGRYGGVVGGATFLALLSSNGIATFVSNFPRQALAYTLAILALSLFLSTRQRLRFTAVALIVVASAIHLSAIIFTPLFASKDPRSRRWLAALLLAVTVLSTLWKKLLSLLLSLEWTGEAPWNSYPNLSGAAYSEIILLYLASCVSLYVFGRRYFRLKKEGRPTVIESQAKAGLLTLALGVIFVLPIWSDVDEFRFRLMMTAYPLLWSGLILTSGRLINSRTFALCCLLFPFSNSGTEFYHYSSANKVAAQILSANSELLDRWLPADAFITTKHGTEFKVHYFLRRESGRVLKPRTEELYKLSSVPPPIKCTQAAALSVIPDDSACLDLSSGWYIYKYPSTYADQCSPYGF